MKIIGTTKNKNYKYIKSLLQKKHRMAEGRYTVEGIKSVTAAMVSGAAAELVAVSESFLHTNETEYPAGVKVIAVRDELFSGLCDTKTPQGIIAVIKMRDNEHYSCDLDKLYIYCDNISDPGNLGTIIRTADAAGFGGVLLSEGCADMYSPKTVRASMGSFFNIDVVPDFNPDALNRERERGFALYCGALLPDSVDYRSPSYIYPAILVVGNEANGVNEEILRMCEHIIIPIYGKAESLNVAIAASIMMYEMRGQRNGK